MAPKYFRSPAEWRAWLEAHHGSETSLLVGMHKANSGRPSMTWSESVDEALCFGWIDGVRKSMGEESYTIRFSVRKAGSIWSRVNIAKARALIASGRIRPGGLGRFEGRSSDRSVVYSYEQRAAEMGEESRSRFMAHRAAWEFFERQPPSYRKRVAWWLSSAKKPATREARLAKVIDLSARMKCL
ncbi:MAG TPA: YdeI/OmpD-associated family protein [Opitutaceae bacterium]